MVLIALAAFIFISSRPEYVPLYTGQLTEREVGDIKAELDKEGYTDYKLSDAGTMIEVPRKDAANLTVTLASKGYPKDNSINYDVFGQNLSFGATDKQTSILERQAMQTQVAEVLKNVDGIKNAEVILTLPEKSVFIHDDTDEKASASVMVEVEPGVELSAAQTKALYTLVSKSVPNLPVQNITIMNQYSETLATEDTSEDQTLSKYDQQRKVQEDVERDIQQNLQSLLGSILGTDKVLVHTFVKMNFDQVKTEENLVKPADKSKNGIPVSTEKITKSYTGKGGSAGGTAGTGETDVPGYVTSSSTGDSTYDETQNRVNYEVNRINNEIVKSPYQIDDITINVGVEGKNNSIPKATEANIRNIASNIVLTALGHPNLSTQQINQRITVFPHTFAADTSQSTASSKLNWWYVGGAAAAAVVLIGALIMILARRRRKKDELEEDEFGFQTQPQVPEIDEYFAEQDMTVESQLKKLLDQRPEDFSKIIRKWLHEEEA